MPTVTNTYIITARIITKAKKEAITQETANSIKIKIRVMPEKGKANKYIISLIAKRLKISKNSIKIVKGEFSNKKTIAIEGFSGSISEFVD